VGTKAENQMQALQMSMVFLLPSVFFSGFIFPRETMPWIFYAFGALFPTTYFIALMRAIILRGANFFEYWPQLAILIVMSALLFAFCASRFRTKIACACDIQLVGTDRRAVRLHRRARRSRPT